MADSKVQRNLRAAMKEALRIQDRFIAEPLFAKTGRGYLKSEGVRTLQKIKSNSAAKPSLRGHEQGLAIDFAGKQYPARATLRPPFDPKNERIMV